MSDDILNDPEFKRARAEMQKEIDSFAEKVQGFLDIANGDSDSYYELTLEDLRRIDQLLNFSFFNFGFDQIDLRDVKRSFHPNSSSTEKKELPEILEELISAHRKIDSMVLVMDSSRTKSFGLEERKVYQSINKELSENIHSYYEIVQDIFLAIEDDIVTRDLKKGFIKLYYDLLVTAEKWNKYMRSIGSPWCDSGSEKEYHIDKFFIYDAKRFFSDAYSSLENDTLRNSDLDKIMNLLGTVQLQIYNALFFSGSYINSLDKDKIIYRDMTSDQMLNFCRNKMKNLEQHYLNLRDYLRSSKPVNDYTHKQFLQISEHLSGLEGAIIDAEGCTYDPLLEQFQRAGIDSDLLESRDAVDKSLRVLSLIHLCYGGKESDLSANLKKYKDAMEKAEESLKNFLALLKVQKDSDSSFPDYIFDFGKRIDRSFRQREKNLEKMIKSAYVESMGRGFLAKAERR